MTSMPIPLDAGQAMCADLDFLPLVDAATAKPGGPEARKMKRILCANCPVSTLCATWAMQHGEAGIWGGTSPKARTMRGAPKLSLTSFGGPQPHAHVG